MASPLALSLTIRFSSSLPDLPIDLADPHLTSTLSLITRIRASLPESDPSSTARIRLIYSGRVLQSTSSVSSALRLPPPPPRKAPPPPKNNHDKGKAPIRPRDPRRDQPETPSPSLPPLKIYIHAHFSEPLSATALSSERAAALDADAALQPPSPTSPSSSQTQHASSSTGGGSGKGKNKAIYPDAGPPSPSSPSARLRRSSTNASATAPPPQGFDRLLGAGLTQMEVASLRSQFVAQLAHTHTPDTMPDAVELRLLEERWLDNDSAPALGEGGGGSSGPQGGGRVGGIRGWLGWGRLEGDDGAAGTTAGGGGGGGGGFLGDEDGGGLEDMLWGNVVGFFWPVAAVLWLMREEGVWSQRRRVAVVTGFLVNFAFGVMRAAG